MQNKMHIALALALFPAVAAAQEFSPSRSITAFTEIADEYYGKPFSVTDLDELDTTLPGYWDEDVEAEVTFAGSVTYADAGQWSWVDPLGSDFEAEGLAAGGLYNQYNGEMRSESLFQADFIVQTSGSVDLSFDMWFGNSFGGLTSHDRPGQSIAEMRIETSTGTVIYSESSTFEDGDLSDSVHVPLGPGQYRLVARAEIVDSTFYETVIGSMTVASFYVEGSINGATPIDTTPPAAPTGLAAVAGDGTVDLDWADNGEGDLAGYHVYRSLASGGPYSALTGSPLATSAFSDTSVSNGTTYHYVVTAVDTSGNESGDSGEASATPMAAGPTVLAYDDFESGFGNYTDGGADCSLNTNSSFAWEGSRSANIQDDSGVASSFFLTNGIDVDSPGYTSIEVSFHYIAFGLKNGEDFFVQYFDGSAWQTVATFAKGTHFNNGTFYGATVVIDEASYNFPAGMKVRFLCDASGDRDDVYVDAITISAQ